MFLMAQKVKQIIYIYSYILVFIYFSLTVKAATLIFTSGRGSAISSAKQGKSGSVYNLVKNKLVV